MSNIISATAFLASMLLVSMTGVNAHMALSNPPPLRGENNPQYDYSNYDYSMTSPLLVDGSNFACKGYNKDVPSISTAVATLKAGQQFTATLEGSATHGGGSCQFSLSYDGGESFGVIHSIIGGCPLAKSYTFTIPQNVPSGKNVLMGWTWFNKQGNREMYMNCAAINIESSATTPLKLPRIFEANIFGAGTCTTLEGDELAFPNPGDSVEYGGMWSSTKPGSDALKVTNCPSDKLDAETSFVTLSSNGAPASAADKPAPSSSSSLPATSPSIPPSSSSDAATVLSSSSPSSSPTLSLGRNKPSAKVTVVNTPISTRTAAGSSKSAATLALERGKSASMKAAAPVSTPATASPAASCSGSALQCSSDGQSFSMCSGGVWVNMGNVASGTVCQNGAIVLAPPKTDSSSTPVSCSANQLKCSSDGQTFSVCNAAGNGYTDMGSVAAGTKCQNGSIVLARMARQKRAGHHARRLDSSH